MWNLKHDTSERVCQTETDSQTQSADLWLPGEAAGGGKGWEAGISRCKLFHTGWVNTVVLYTTGPVTDQNGKEYREEYICACACV